MKVMKVIRCKHCKKATCISNENGICMLAFVVPDPVRCRLNVE